MCSGAAEFVNSPVVNLVEFKLSWRVFRVCIWNPSSGIVDILKIVTEKYVMKFRINAGRPG